MPEGSGYGAGDTQAHLDEMTKLIKHKEEAAEEEEAEAGAEADTTKNQKTRLR